MALTHVLLFFHLLGAFCFFAGGAVVGVLQRLDRPGSAAPAGSPPAWECRYGAWRSATAYAGDIPTIDLEQMVADAKPIR